MAKRARGAHGRPGQRRPTPRTGRPAPQPAGNGATRAAAASPAPDPVADEGPVAAPEQRPGRAAAARARGTSASFETSAAQEYAYVAHDVRRIAVVGGSLFAVLIVLFLLIEVLGVIHL